ncbi:hypothetical protein ABL78_0443 [Leptomonas seymouri]|uniref:Actin-like protein n=1 Tax=Leptomonas seymouri TaxID=5684 RepID=A0A0N0P973_LEPSE|nr:hypothetical protein ABL78_0443 [Leptomonas seymouri]|eukprot:KPI90367.1 hypothetical protein ABL78_0443 [Leptomonas seymouri]
MASSSPAIVLYAGSAATYICEAGDVQPTYPLVQPITKEVLCELQSSQFSTSSSSLGDRKTSHVKQSTAVLRKHLLPLLHDRTVFLVLPLSSSTSYSEEWVRFCFHAEVHVRRLVVLSDTIADSFACNRNSCIVLHVSLSTVSVCRVEAGCSTRYGNSHVGGVHALCGGGETVMLKMVERLPTVAAAMATSKAETTSGSAEEGDDDGMAANDISYTEELGIDLSDVKYRDELIRAFGYKAYRAVIVVPQQQRMDAASKPPAKGKGKGSDRVQRRSRASSSVLNALRRAYPREVREAPGQLEKLLARVVQGGSVAPSSLEETEPCILAGEALAVPYVRQLYAFIICRCGGAVWDAVELERRAKQRRVSAGLSERGYVDGASMTQQGTEGASFDPDKGSSIPMPKRIKKEASDSSDSSSDDRESDDDDDWLHLQPTPLPTAPWWLPLLGASVVSRLPDQDLQRAYITEEEARESNGNVVHWKVLL